MAQEQVHLKHPHTGEEVTVDATSEALTPWMVKGYQQVQPPATPAAEE